MPHLLKPGTPPTRGRRTPVGALPGLAVACLAAAAPAQVAPERLVDPNPTPVPGTVVEHRVVGLGTSLFYPGTAPGTGVELYRVPTAGGPPQLVRDGFPGPGDGDPFALTPAGAKLYYFADDGVHGFEPWWTDGVQSGLVLDVYPGIASSAVPDDGRREPLGVLNGALLFAADDGARGYGLWRSDGSPAGTGYVKALGDPPRRTGFAQWATANGFGLFLVPFDRPGEHGLWQTDGTAAGTKRLRGLTGVPASPLRVPYRIQPVDRAAFVTGVDTLLLVQPAAGFTTIIELQLGSMVHAGFGPVRDPLTGKGLFLCSGGTYLWRSDGTATGTVPFYPGSGPGVLQSFEQEPAVIRDRMLFFGFDLPHGEEPWITDGTAGGTRLLRDVRPGPPDATSQDRYGEACRVTTDGTRFYFTADDGIHGREVWVSDGSTSGTRILADLRPGSAGSAPRQLVGLPAGGGVAFVADDGGGAKLWLYDAGTARVRTAAAGFATYPGRTAPSRVLGLLAHDGRLYFAADDGASGSELWTSDGTRQGTALVKDIQPGRGSALRHHDLRNGPEYGRLSGIGLGTELYFNAYEQPGRLAMFRTDGTAAGTVKVRDLDLIGGDGWPLQGVAVGETMYFQGFAQAAGEGLFAMRAGTTTMVRLAATAPGRHYPLGDRLIFTDGFPPALRGVWVTDGTPQGTVALARFPNFVVDPFLFARIGHTGFFSTMHQGGALWQTDGTVAGSRFLRVASIHGMVAMGGQLWTLEEVGSGMRLLRGDGSTAGTAVVAAALPRTGQGLLAVGGRLYFAAYNGNQSELWTSDGTAAGTVLLRGFSGWGAVFPRLEGFTPLGSRRLLFRVMGDAGIGGELWQSDGTTAGTRPVMDLHRGPEGDNGAEIALVNGSLLFRGDDGRRGSVDGDLFAIPSGAAAYASGPGCARDGHPPELSATDPVLGGAFDLELLGAANKAMVFFLGIESPAPLLLPRGCRIHPDPGTAYQLNGTTDGAGRWAMRGIPVANDPTLQGLRLAAQAGVASGLPMPLEADLSNGLVLVIGR